MLLRYWWSLRYLPWNPLIRRVVEWWPTRSHRRILLSLLLRWLICWVKILLILKLNIRILYWWNILRSIHWRSLNLLWQYLLLLLYLNWNWRYLLLNWLILMRILLMNHRLWGSFCWLSAILVLLLLNFLLLSLWSSWSF